MMLTEIGGEINADRGEKTAAMCAHREAVNVTMMW